MWKLTPSTTAGYVLNVAGGQETGVLTAAERARLRDLAQRVAELAAEPGQEEKRRLWYRLNALEPTRPLLLAFPEDSWGELLPPKETVTIADPGWQQLEWLLKHFLYRHEFIDDDLVVEPCLYVPVQIKTGDWGIEPARVHRPEEANGAYAWTPPLQELADIDKLHPATLEVDWPATQRRLGVLGEVVGDILPVQHHCASSTFCLIDVAAHLRGAQQLMLDMYDNPAWVHRLMAFLASEEMRKRQFLEAKGLLTLNNRNHYIAAGAIGYTDELPAAGFDGKRVRLKDLWVHAAAQAASEIGPVQHEEFILEHELPILEQGGLVAYGCCEPYTCKFDMLKRRVPKLRRVSISPWCDLEAAAEALADKCILSWKPNPAMLVGAFSPERIRTYIREALEKTRGCRLEISLKDTITLDREPQRLHTWLRLAREEIERFAA